MSNLKVGFIYNVRHRYRDPEDPRFQLEADFDDPNTIKKFIEHLTECKYTVFPIEADIDAYSKLKKLRNTLDIVFNYSEGIYGQDREAQLPAMLEMLQIPYTGSGPLTQCLSLNKAKTKEVLMAHNISTLPFQIFTTGEEVLNGKLGFPLIVKPVAQGSGAGINNKSIVSSDTELKKQVKRVVKNFQQPAIVEPFLQGREFSLSMLGNPPEILPIIEPDFSKLPDEYLPIDSLQVKWIYEESGHSHLVCPAKIDNELSLKIKTIGIRTWEALEIKDWCRVDIRCDRNGRPYVLEINSPAGMIPPELSQTSYFPLAARTAGISYQETLKKIVETSLNRHGIKKE